VDKDILRIFADRMDSYVSWRRSGIPIALETISEETSDLSKVVPKEVQEMLHKLANMSETVNLILQEEVFVMLELTAWFAEQGIIFNMARGWINKEDIDAT